MAKTKTFLFRIARNFQVTIPKKIRANMRLEIGDYVYFNDKFELKKLQKIE